jgi:hypothetical protein
MKARSPRSWAFSSASSTSARVSKRMTLVEKTRVHLLGWALRAFGGVVRLAIGLLWFVRPPHRAVVREEAADFAG